MQDPVISDLYNWLRTQDLNEQAIFQYCLELHQYYGFILGSSVDFDVRFDLGDCNVCPLQSTCKEYNNELRYDIRCASFSPSQMDNEIDYYDEQYKDFVNAQKVESEAK